MRRAVGVVLTMVVVLWCTVAWGRVYIDITKPFSRQLPIAVGKFMPLPGAGEDPVGRLARAKLVDNLAFTGLFDFIPPESFISQPDLTHPDCRKWTKIGAELLITGGYQLKGGFLTIECRLFDVVEGKMLTGRRYEGTPKDVGAMMARFADEVMLALTGERSVFSTMIAFVSARGGIKEIMLMRYDGSGVRKFTHREDICLYPAWSPKGKFLAYCSYVSRRPAVFIHALAGGSGRVVVNRPGVNITPVFTPTGDALAVSMSFTGRTNIYLVNLAGRILRKLTNGWGIDVAPSFSPDGKRMAFVSDRGGSPQVYVLELATGRVYRLVYGFKYTAAPAWSPKGDRIAFQAQVDGVFQVATIRPDGTDLQVLTRGYGGGEDPSWSPDGRLIAYASRRTGSYQIYVMTSAGQPIRRLTNLPGDQTDPAWSPRGLAVR